MTTGQSAPLPGGEAPTARWRADLDALRAAPEAERLNRAEALLDAVEAHLDER